MARTWSEWTAALAVAEALTDWAVDDHPDRWAEDEDPRPQVMVLLAYAIEAAARAAQLRAAEPDQLCPLRLHQIREYLTPDNAYGLLESSDGLGPGPDDLGLGEARDLIRKASGGDPDRWRHVIVRARNVLRQHEAAAPVSERSALTISARRQDMTRVVADQRRRHRNASAAVLNDELPSLPTPPRDRSR
jgi:hypothetical protein